MGQDWDTHEKNFHLMKNVLLPPIDRAVSTLLDDLHDRGLLETTLVAILTEFGRTPRINANSGRDHWPNVFSVMLAGGGIMPGVVLGGSTRSGDEPKDRPTPISDVLATIYHQLGVSTKEALRDSEGRPVTVLEKGKPIDELLERRPQASGRSDTFAPASSSLRLLAWPSAAAIRCWRTRGGRSLMSLPSANPQPVISRSTLMTAIFLPGSASPSYTTDTRVAVAPVASEVRVSRIGSRRLPCAALRTPWASARYSAS
jgi:hypothetical protein